MRITPRSQVIKIAQNCAPQSQTAHCGVKNEIFVSLWLLLKGQSGEILLGVNTSINKEKNLIKKKKISKHTAELNFSKFVIKYLCEIETEF